MGWERGEIGMLTKVYGSVKHHNVGRLVARSYGVEKSMQFIDGSDAYLSMSSDMLRTTWVRILQPGDRVEVLTDESDVKSL